jgi:hypothetical protein
VGQVPSFSTPVKQIVPLPASAALGVPATEKASDANKRNNNLNVLFLMIDWFFIVYLLVI